MQRDRFALRLEEVREVARACWPERLPRAPFGCLGAVNVRGERIPLMDLGVLAGIRRPWRVEELPARLVDAHLVLLEQSPPVALVVDRVIEVDEGAEEPQGAIPLAAATLLNPKRRALLARAASRTPGVA